LSVLTKRLISGHYEPIPNIIWTFR